MRKLFLTILVMISMVPMVEAMRTRKPPTFNDLQQSNQLTELNIFLSDVFDVINGRYTLENIDINPDGNRKGVKGDLVYATFGGLDHLCINTSFPAAKDWTCVNVGTLSTCPGGADGDVQFNDDGTCGGDDAFRYDKNSHHLILDADGNALPSLTNVLTLDAGDFGGTSSRSNLNSIGFTHTIPDGNTIASFQANQFGAPTINGVSGGSAETLTQASTVYIEGAPSGSNVTNTYPLSLYVDAGNTDLDGHLAVGGSGTVDETTTNFRINSFSNINTKEVANLNETFTDNTAGNAGLLVQTFHNYSSATSNKWGVGIQSVNEIVDGMSVLMDDGIVGVDSRVRNLGTGTVDQAIGYNAYVEEDSGATVTHGFGMLVKAFSKNTPPNGALTGICISDTVNTTEATCGGKTGLHIELHERGSISAGNAVTNITSEQGDWDDGFNVLGGATLIGSLTGANQVAASLWVRGDAQGISETLNGTLTTSGTSATASSASFSTGTTNVEAVEGDVIVSSSRNRLLTNIANSTTATLNRAFTTDLSGATVTYKKPILRWDIDGDEYGDTRGGVINALGHVGIGIVDPSHILEIAPWDYGQGNTGDHDVERSAFKIDSSSHELKASATITNWRNAYFGAPTFTGQTGTTETVTNAATVYIENAPQESSSASITNPYALWIDSGFARIDGRTTVTGLVVNDSTTGGCLMLRDTDDAGWTECCALNGTLSCGIDADGEIDGTP